MKCEKCGYKSKNIREKSKRLLCQICYPFSPEDEDSLNKYVNEKIDSSILETFRKYSVSAGEKQKQGMIKKAIQGNLMSRVPFGYKIHERKLVPIESSKEIEEIFEEFLNENLSLRKIAEKHKLSVNGLKKILRNFTYIGKIKFNNQIYEGNHQPLVSTTLFNHVQNKLEKLGIK
ncbi:MAG TPA: recombinase family protein [Bacillota bacterium]|nr:recombinase family protein [Bacillota bacterium]